MTNYEKIKSMSVRDAVDFMKDVLDCSLCNELCKKRMSKNALTREKCDKKCEKHCKEWLKSEAN